MRTVIFSAAFFLLTPAFAQTELPADDWFLQRSSEELAATNTDRAYLELLAGRTPVPVIVAVLDSGVDIEHEDLRDQVWTNADEVPNNGIDDDGNGYIDDVNGWSFLGGEMEDVRYANLEFTRIYRDLKRRFDGKSSEGISKAEKSDYERYLAMDDEYQRRLRDAEAEASQFRQVDMFYGMCKQTLSSMFQGDEYTVEDLQNIQTDDEFLQAVREFMIMALQEDFDRELKEGREHFDSMFEYAYNLDYDPRPIIGDDPSNLTERHYGCNRVKGPAAGHGTHVAGIIAANRSNEVGIRGIADATQIMAVRTVPDGDERDKDVANAIYYAVDNGAAIINMSFGKSYSPNKPVVDEAVRYAASKGVLLIHASGNSSRDNDRSANFPNDTYADGSQCPTWIEVGAHTADPGSDLPAVFSNYGRKEVDVFAPGESILSTYPEGDYVRQQGTSMAAPMVAGAAALLKSYFPELTATDLREILLESARSYGKVKVVRPGGGKSKFKKLSVTGGVLDVYRAVELALQRTS